LSPTSAPARTPLQATQLLVAWRDGHKSALDQLALVDEAFIRLMNWRDVSSKNRSHFP
jgi:hypothetical protein